MSSTILVNKVRSDQSEGTMLLTLDCELLNGKVAVGQHLRLPFSSGLDMTIPVDDLIVSNEIHVSIIVRCEDEEEIRFLNGLGLEGETLEVLFL